MKWLKVANGISGLGTVWSVLHITVEPIIIIVSLSLGIVLCVTKWTDHKPLKPIVSCLVNPLTLFALMVSSHWVKPRLRMRQIVRPIKMAYIELYEGVHTVPRQYQWCHWLRHFIGLVSSLSVGQCDHTMRVNCHKTMGYRVLNLTYLALLIETATFEFFCTLSFSAKSGLKFKFSGCDHQMSMLAGFCYDLAENDKI